MIIINLVYDGGGCNLHEEDKTHLEKLKKSLDSTHPISKKDQYYNTLIVGIKSIGEDLVNLGCLPKKSLILKYPTEEQVPLELQHHFIRGIFDGDGSLGWRKDVQRYGTIHIAGTYDLLDGIKNFLQLTTINTICNQGKICILNIQNKQGIYEFYNKIYKDSDIYLDRKYLKFQDFIKSISSKIVKEIIV